MFSSARWFLLATLFYTLICVYGEKKYYIIPFSLEDCDPSIRIFDSEYTQPKLYGPHHITFDFTHFVLKEQLTEPMMAAVLIEKQKGDKWKFVARPEFPLRCVDMHEMDKPWTGFVQSFPEKLTCPIQPMNVPLLNVTFDGDLSEYFDFDDGSVGTYRMTVTGSAMVGINPKKPMGCMIMQYRIEGIEE